MRKLLLIAILAGTIYNLPKLINPLTPSDEVVKNDFYFLIVSNKSGSAARVNNPNGWRSGGFNTIGLSGDYRTRIAEFTIARKPPTISDGAIGTKGEKIYRVEVYKKIEREYEAHGEVEKIYAMLPKTEITKIGCYYFKTKDGKWTHTPEEKL